MALTAVNGITNDDFNWANFRKGSACATLLKSISLLKIWKMLNVYPIIIFTALKPSTLLIYPPRLFAFNTASNIQTKFKLKRMGGFKPPGNERIKQIQK